MTSRVGLFVDVSNIYHCVGKRFPGRKVDYGKLSDMALNHGTLNRATAYGSQVNEEAIGFITCLRKIGFDTKYKRPKEEGERLLRADWNVGISCDVISALVADKLDTVILSSNNIELLPLITSIRGFGTRCIVIACGISQEIKAVADQYIEISEDLLEEHRN